MRKCLTGGWLLNRSITWGGVTVLCLVVLVIPKGSAPRRVGSSGDDTRAA